MKGAQEEWGVTNSLQWVFSQHFPFSYSMRAQQGEHTRSPS